MKAIVFDTYGSPESVLSVSEVAKPVPEDSEVLIKIRATAVNDYDWSQIRGKPYLYRLLYGIIKPRNRIAGMELAGIVSGLGRNVRKFKVGDAVFGDISKYGFGTFAEYICIHENAVVHKPDEISFEVAAAIPHASLLALQALRDQGGIGQGQKVLINGAGGGVGTIALQLAKLYSCEVTGVDSNEKLDMMRSIGFDHVIDYKKVNFTKTGDHYDLILDCKSDKRALSCLRALKPKGCYVTIGGSLPYFLDIFIWGRLISYFSYKKLKVLILKPNEGLDYICELVAQNKIRCIIDGPYCLKDTARLIQYFGEGKHKGKIVIRMNPGHTE